MTNLEIMLIYFAIGFVWTLVYWEITHNYFAPEDVLFGVTCWFPIVIAMLMFITAKNIKRFVKHYKRQKAW